MSGYRIEVSPNNRAGCQDSVCKATGAKIIKGSLRFGTWVNIMEHGGWRWKHWGCVSGNQLESVRNSAATGDGYDWDTIDGYDEMGDHPDLQEKIRTAIEEGHIAAEDFNGDPEYNVLGQRAIRSRAAVKAAKDGEDPPAAEDKGTTPKGTTPKKTPAKGTKRGRKTAAADSDEEEEEADETPVTKRAKKATPAKSEPATTPRPRGRPRKSAAKAEVDSDEADMVHAVTAPAPRGRGRPRKAAAAPKEEEPEDEEEEEQSKKKKAAPRGRPKKVREPDSDEEDMVHAVPIPPRGRGRPRKST